MTDSHHLRMLLSNNGTPDVPIWNKWRHQNGAIKPDFSGLHMQSLRLKGANLQGANFRGADLFDADFSGANLRNADFTGASLLMAKFDGADLTQTKFRYARLVGASLQGSRSIAANFKYADLRSTFFGNASVDNIKFNRWSNFKGIRVESCHGSTPFKRFAMDQDYIEEFRGNLKGENESRIRLEKHRYPRLFEIKKFIKNFPSPRENIKFWLSYLPWLIFTDCGRSLSLWGAWSILAATAFGAVFADYTVPAFLPDWFSQFLIDINPEFELQPNRGITRFTPYYFSIVTFTTLGFGDVVPTNLAGEIWLTLEVILGYMMLGGLVSILANKIARRS